MEKRESKILDQINKDMNAREFKEAAEDIIATMPSIVNIHKSMNEEMKKQGYTDKQSFEFASEYTLRVLKLK